MSKNKKGQGEAENGKTATMESPALERTIAQLGGSSPLNGEAEDVNTASHFSTPEAEESMTGKTGTPMPDEKREESKSDRFKRLANKRLNNAVKRIGLLGSLSNRSQYEYTSEQIGKMLAILVGECDKLAVAFQGKKKTEATNWF